MNSDGTHVAKFRAADDRWRAFWRNRRHSILLLWIVTPMVGLGVLMVRKQMEETRQIEVIAISDSRSVQQWIGTRSMHDVETTDGTYTVWHRLVMERDDGIQLEVGGVYSVEVLDLPMYRPEIRHVNERLE